MEDKYLFSLLEDPHYYNGVNTIDVNPRNYYTEEEIKSGEYIINDNHYPIFTINELPKIMKENPGYNFYKCLLNMVDDEWKQKILDSGVEIKEDY